MKIPFDLKWKPQIESGEYKVIDQFGYVLTLRDIINDVWYFSLRYPNTDYETERIYDHPENHLFIVTTEPELSEFEKEYIRLYKEGYADGKAGSKPISDDNLKEYAAELLALARKELCEQIVDHTKEAYENGKAEALKDLPRWKKCADGPKPKPSNEWIFSIDSENVTRESAIVHKGYFLPLDGLEKLPGFKEEKK